MLTEIYIEALLVDEYLADQTAPVHVVDRLAPLLLESPSQSLARLIRRWTVAQVQAQEDGLGLTQLFVHALKKLHNLGQLDLIPREGLNERLQAADPRRSRGVSKRIITFERSSSRRFQ